MRRRSLHGLVLPSLWQVIAVSAPGTVTVVGRCGGHGMHLMVVKKVPLGNFRG